MDPINQTNPNLGQTPASHSKTPLAILILIVVVGLGVYFYMGKGMPASTTSNTATTTPTDKTQEQRKQEVEAVLQTAVDAVSIDVSSCKPFPETAQFKMGSTVEFVNQDSVARTIAFSPEHTFKIPLKGKLKVKFDFFKIQGIRKYTCDGESAGKVVITL